MRSDTAPPRVPAPVSRFAAAHAKVCVRIGDGFAQVRWMHALCRCQLCRDRFNSVFSFLHFKKKSLTTLFLSFFCLFLSSESAMPGLVFFFILVRAIHKNQKKIRGLGAPLLHNMLLLLRKMENWTRKQTRRLGNRTRAKGPEAVACSHRRPRRPPCLGSARRPAPRHTAPHVRTAGHLQMQLDQTTN
jgi:hypothetical protein